MTDLGKPVLRVVTAAEDYANKPGGGGQKEPLVPITGEFLGGLVEALENSPVGLPAVVRTGRRAGALVVQLRESAWAKSNRPNSFLEAAGLEVAAVAGVGELIVPIVPASLAALRQQILGVRTRREKFWISTIETFRPWSIVEVFPESHWREDPDLVPRALEAGRAMRIELFPWAARPGELEGLGEIVQFAHPLEERFLYFRPNGMRELLELSEIPEVRHVVIEPQYANPHEFVAQSFVQLHQAVPDSVALPLVDGPVVGVIDSGIAPGLVAAFVDSRTQYELPPDTDHMHGTFVGGLIAASKLLNQSDPRFPEDRARIVDIAALPNGPVDENLLLQRMIDAVNRHPDVRVWNCSFADSGPNHPARVGAFAAALDKMSDEKNVLFVVAAGNYYSDPARGWPDNPAHFPADRVAMPGEAARALTVGAIVPQACVVPVDCPAPYSRRGPGPAHAVKPEVVHYGGGVDAAWNISGGVRSLLPNDRFAEGVGTSFSTPIVSAIAANAWHALDEAGVGANPTLVKALVLHAAALNSVRRPLSDRSYFGHGVPKGSVASLFCDPNSFTLLFEAELQQGVDWAKDNFPIPACLLTAEGKFRGEIVITMCYPSPCSIAFGDEYVQHDVDLSFGTYDLDHAEVPPKRKQVGKVPADRPVGLSTRERALLEDAMKFSTAKVYRKRFPEGCAFEQWRLKLTLTRRLEIDQNLRQPVFVLVTLRGLEPDLPVYVDGLRALPQAWRVEQLVPAVDQRVRVGG